jgi:hypothetical protein
MANFKIEADGSFYPSDQQTLPQGELVTFTLGEGATWSTVYVYDSGGAPSRGLFGTSSVLVSRGGIISSTAPIGAVYTLSISATGPIEQVPDLFTGHNGTIKVGGS